MKIFCLPAPNDDVTRRAFTLVEMAIVLVIIGLIVGGILVGRDLIRTAEIRSAAKQYQTWQSALQTFRLRYNALPGDIRNPTNYGLSNSTIDYGHSAVSGCDYGNGIIEDGYCSAYGSVTGYAKNLTAEVLLFWTHLAQTGLIEGQYDATYWIAPGVSYPVFALGGKDSGVAPATMVNYNDANNYFITCVSSKYSGSFKTGFVDSCIAVNDAYDLDTKLDDGKPYTGNIFTMHAGSQSYYGRQPLSASGACATSYPASSTATYAITNSWSCVLAMKF